MLYNIRHSIVNCSFSLIVTLDFFRRLEGFPAAVASLLIKLVVSGNFCEVSAANPYPLVQLVSHTHVAKVVKTP